MAVQHVVGRDAERVRKMAAVRDLDGDAVRRLLWWLSAPAGTLPSGDLRRAVARTQPLRPLPTRERVRRTTRG
jgi:hypothetical protein